MIGDGFVQAKSRHDAEKRGEIDPKLLLGLFNGDEVHCLFHMQSSYPAGRRQDWARSRSLLVSFGCAWAICSAR
jgi:hypothetical protein